MDPQSIKSKLYFYADFIPAGRHTFAIKCADINNDVLLNKPELFVH